MNPETDDQAIQADAYIDDLLTGHGRMPVAVGADGSAGGGLRAQPGVRDAIRLLEKGLPRFHPSFRFEESLAEQLRRAADRKAAVGGEASSLEPIGQIVPIAVIPRTDPLPRLPDRRLLMGGAAIAAGVSIAGAAVFAWRRVRT
jgi:hypothetical protein